MRCNNCGKKLDDSITVCPICGRTIAAPKPSPAPVQPVIPDTAPKPAPTTTPKPAPAPTPTTYTEPVIKPVIPPEPVQAAASTAAPTPKTVSPEAAAVPSEQSPFDKLLSFFKNQSDNRKKMFAIIAVIAVILIVILAVALRPVESKIRGTWRPVEASNGQEIDDVTWTFEKGYGIYNEPENDYKRNFYYDITDDVLEIYEIDHMGLKYHSNRYIIDKITSTKLVLREDDSDITMTFKKE